MFTKMIVGIGSLLSLLVLRLSGVECQLLAVQDQIIQKTIRTHDLDRIYANSIQMIEANMLNDVPGTIVASPSRRDPDYYYHWIRDASITYKTMFLVNNSLGYDFASITKLHQLYDLGEPKFYVDGMPFDKAWARPQNDGPALRALAFMTFIKNRLSKNGSLEELSWLYKAELPPTSILKLDLEYIGKQWQNRCFDLWEEQFALHYYTLIAQSAALKQGATVAKLFNDTFAAEYYQDQYEYCQGFVDKNFWDDRGFLKSMISGGDSFRLDISVLLACIHTSEYLEGLCSSSRTLATSAHLAHSFELEYPINFNIKPPLIGRYAADVYNGTGTSLGNPWVLSTFGMAEYLYTVAREFQAAATVKVTNVSIVFFDHFFKDMKLRPGVIRGNSLQTLVNRIVFLGDSFLYRVLDIIDMNFSEQLHRVTGQRRGARDLTWSYTAFVSAINARRQIV